MTDAWWTMDALSSVTESGRPAPCTPPVWASHQPYVGSIMHVWIDLCELLIDWSAVPARRSVWIINQLSINRSLASCSSRGQRDMFWSLPAASTCTLDGVYYWDNLHVYARPCSLAVAVKRFVCDRMYVCSSISSPLIPLISLVLWG
jgi:hypothetical protein